MVCVVADNTFIDFLTTDQLCIDEADLTVTIDHVTNEICACSPRCSSDANAGGRAFCHVLDIGWVHIVQWIFSILAISAGLFWRKSVFCVFTL